MGIRDKRCIDAIAMGLLTSTCLNVISENYSKKNEFRLNLKKRLLSEDGREILKSREGADILRKTVEQMGLGEAINTERGNYDETLCGLNRYIQNASKKELHDFCAALCKESNLRGFRYKRE